MIGMIYSACDDRLHQIDLLKLELRCHVP